MKTVANKIIVNLIILALHTGVLNAQRYNSQPNIILILADDLGWIDLSCYGSTFYETPNLDKLASNGIRFTNGYSASPVCSPTRASILTGKYPIKTGITDWIKGRQDNGSAKPYEKLIADTTAYQLRLEENTISEFALANGYTTFFAGKWHLGEDEKFWPLNHGFLKSVGGWSKGSPTGKKNDTTGGFFTPYQNPTLPDGPAGEYLTDRLTNECLKFIEQKNDSPFFIFHSMYAVHNPLQAPRALIKKYEQKNNHADKSDTVKFAKDEPWMQLEKDWRNRVIQDNPVYAAMIENMDWNIGRLINKLEELKQLDNTLIIFTSDNGGLSTAEGSPTSNIPLRGGKGWLYEGGIRVPFILYWKGKAEAGTVSDLPIHSADIFPTLASIVNRKYKKPDDIDGENILKMVTNYQRYKNRVIIWDYPHYSNQGGKPGAAILRGKYKLIYHFEDNRIELFNLDADIGEQSNIASEHKAKSRVFRKKLLRWLKQHTEDRFKANPGYRPDTILPVENKIFR
jgi:arylsulfatase A-like enzyme